MTAVFENEELQFMYPENWKLVQSGDTDDFVEISLESPAGGIWSVSVFNDGSSTGDLLESCAAALSEQYEDFERNDFMGEVGGIQAIGFDSHFYCLDFLVTAQVRAFELNGHTVNVFCQAESREFDKSQEVFNAITQSLLQGLK